MADSTLTATSTAPLERAAKAIYETLDGDRRGHPLSSLRRSVGPETGFEGRCYIDGFVDLKAIARAAIVAIREPSEKMVQAAYDADLDIYWAYNGGDETGDGYGPEHAWRVMIDAALAEEG